MPWLSFSLINGLKERGRFRAAVGLKSPRLDPATQTPTRNLTLVQSLDLLSGRCHAGNPSKARQGRDESTEEQTLTTEFSGKACSAVWAGGGSTERVDTAGGDAVTLALEPDMRGQVGWEVTAGPPQAPRAQEDVRSRGLDGSTLGNRRVSAPATWRSSHNSKGVGMRQHDSALITAPLVSANY